LGRIRVEVAIWRVRQKHVSRRELLTSEQPPVSRSFEDAVHTAAAGLLVHSWCEESPITIRPGESTLQRAQLVTLLARPASVAPNGTHIAATRGAYPPGCSESGRVC
jgi:hypothetical protein